ncbi:MAG: GNAT family N-acetyltransferase [Pseudomonadota bacterium]
MDLCFDSDRLSFRPLELSDLDLAIAQWTDPEVTRYIAPKTHTVEEVEAEMPISIRRCGGGCIGIWCLTDKRSGEKVGTAILLPLPVELDDTDWDLVQGEGIPEGDIEIGYVLRRSAWGKGYATEACARLLRFAFEVSPLQEVVATIDPSNSASRHVLQKCGLRDNGMIRAYAETLPGFRITRAEWVNDEALRTGG